MKKLQVPKNERFLQIIILSEICHTGKVTFLESAWNDGSFYTHIDQFQEEEKNVWPYI
jgi:hypothetical protein